MKTKVNISNRHIHLTKEVFQRLFNKDDLIDKEEVIVNNIFNAFIKVSDNGYYELHIDKEEAKEYNLNIGEEVEFFKK